MTGFVLTEAHLLRDVNSALRWSAEKRKSSFGRRDSVDYDTRAIWPLRQSFCWELRNIKRCNVPV